MLRELFVGSLVGSLGVLSPATGCAPNDVDSAGAEAYADQSRAPDNEIDVGFSWRDPIEVASGNAHRGRWRMNESNFDYIDDGTVAFNERGEVGVAWVDNADQNVYFQRYDADGNPALDEPTNVSGSGEIFSWLPRIVISDDDPMHVYALWQEIIFSGGSHGGEILFARSTDGGETFSDPINLSNTTAGAGKGRMTGNRWHNGSLDIVAGPEGHLYAAWTEYEGRLWFARSTDRGASFDEPLRIDGFDNTNPARGPALAVDTNTGAIHLAWTVGEDQRADIHFASSDDDGRSFSEPRVVAETGGYSDAPKLGVDSGSTVHLVFGESPSGMFRRSSVWYASMAEGDDGFSEPRDITGEHGEAYASVVFPDLALDGEDNLYVLWDLKPTVRGRPHGLGLTRSAGGGDAFGPPIVVPGTGEAQRGSNGSQQGMLMRKLAVRSDGAVAVVNSTFDQGARSRVELILGRAE